MKNIYLITVCVGFSILIPTSRMLAKENINLWGKYASFYDKNFKKIKNGKKKIYAKFLNSLSQDERLKLLIQCNESEYFKKTQCKDWYKAAYFIIFVMKGFVGPNITKEEFSKLSKKEQIKIREKEEQIRKKFPDKAFDKIFNALTDINNKKNNFFRFAMFFILKHGEFNITSEQDKRLADLALKYYDDKRECEPIRSECLEIVSNSLKEKLVKSISSIMELDANIKKIIKEIGYIAVIGKIQKNELNLKPNIVKKLQPFLKQAKEFNDYLKVIPKNETQTEVFKFEIECAIINMNYYIPLNLLENKEEQNN